jgi:3-oxoacyl-[acyl-carrier protein] reductase
VEFKGKVAIITGAGGAGPGGLGVDYARALANEGAAVVLSDMDGASAKRIAKELADQGHRAVGIAADVSDEQAVEAMVRETKSAFGGVDILINNAGLCRGKWGQGIDLPTADWIKIFAVNTVAPLVCTRACRESMKARGGGVVINIASSAAFEENGAYSVTKTAVIAMTNLLSLELGGDNIRVNALSPGMMHGNVPSEQAAAYRDKQKLRRRGSPEDLIGALLYLCSERSSFVTGMTLRVDGGVIHGHI